MATRSRRTLIAGALEPQQSQMFPSSLSVPRDDVGIGVRRSPRISERDVELKKTARRIPTPPRGTKNKILVAINQTGQSTSSFDSRRPQNQQEFSDDETNYSSRNPTSMQNQSNNIQRFANFGSTTWSDAKQSFCSTLRHARSSLWDSKSDSGRLSIVLAVLISILIPFVLPYVAKYAKEISDHSRNVFLSLPDLFTFDSRMTSLDQKRSSSPDSTQSTIPDLNQLVDKLISDPKFQDLIRAEHSKRTLNKSLQEDYESRFSDLITALQTDAQQRTNKLQTDIQTLGKELDEKVNQARNNVPDFHSELESLKSSSDESQRILASKLTSLKIDFQTIRQDIESLKQSGKDLGQISAKISSLEMKLISLSDEYQLVAKTVKGCQENCTKVEVQVSDLVKDMLEQNKLSQSEEITSTVAKFLDEYSLQDRLDKLSADLSTEMKEELRVMVQQNLESSLRNHVETFESAIYSQTTQLQPNFSKEEVSRIVQEALMTYDADKTGLFDFALESAGGTIVNTRCTETYDVSNAIYSIFGLPFWWAKSNPRTILQPGSSPGQCWAFKGSHGSVVIGLSSSIYIGAVTLEHIPSSLAPDGSISSAPKQIQILGLTSTTDEDPKVLGNFTYNKDLAPVQTFFLSPKPSEPFRLVELKVLSNHGNMAYTCIYRFRVHGKLENRSQE